MISRPSTEEILEACSAQLLDEIVPTMEPGAASTALVMLAKVLRNTAVRAAHEIAWMIEERDAVLEFARRVAEASGDTAEALKTAMAAPASLHLDDVIGAYDRVGEALAVALELADKSGDAQLTEEGSALIEDRLAHERHIMGGWGEVAGR